MIQEKEFSVRYHNARRCEGMALLIGYLRAEIQYQQDTIPSSDGWWPFSIRKIEDDIGMSSDRQQKYLWRLAEAGVLETKVAGSPAKRFIRLLDQKTGAPLTKI